jgi:inorganic pyrophosphatase
MAFLEFLMSINLDAKAVRFIVDAIHCKIDALRKMQDENQDDEDVVADSSNDIGYYHCIIADLESQFPLG